MASHLQGYFLHSPKSLSKLDDARNIFSEQTTLVTQKTQLLSISSQNGNVRYWEQWKVMMYQSRERMEGGGQQSTCVDGRKMSQHRFMTPSLDTKTNLFRFYVDSDSALVQILLLGSLLSLVAVTLPFHCINCNNYSIKRGSGVWIKKEENESNSFIHGKHADTEERWK